MNSFKSPRIVTAPNPVLSQPAKLLPIDKVEKIDNGIKKIIAEMKEALLSAKDPEGVGLAAPQIGKSLRIFMIKPNVKSTIKTFINPKIIELRPVIEDKPKRKKLDGTKLEGCLSLPNIWGIVQRKPEVTLYYMDEQGREHTEDFKGFTATIIQHEMDHLEGILFPKRVLEQKGSLFKSKKNKKGEDEFEEIEL